MQESKVTKSEVKFIDNPQNGWVHSSYKRSYTHMMIKKHMVEKENKSGHARERETVLGRKASHTQVDAIT